MEQQIAGIGSEWDAEKLDSGSEGLVFFDGDIWTYFRHTSRTKYRHTVGTKHACMPAIMQAFRLSEAKRVLNTQHLGCAEALLLDSRLGCRSEAPLLACAGTILRV